jgi:hypothetical protein
MTEEVNKEEAVELKRTESGIEYSEHTFERNDGVVKTVRLFRDFSNQRLDDEDETYEEYKIRRILAHKAMKYRIKGTLLWTPYPFGKAAKGLTYNEKNREVMKAVQEKYEQSLKDKELKKEEE